PIFKIQIYLSSTFQLQNTFQLDSEFTVKYTDVDGDLCTIGGNEEFEDMIKSDLVKDRKGTLRLRVIPNNRGGNRRSSLFRHRREDSEISIASTASMFLSFLFFSFLYLFIIYLFIAPLNSIY